MGRVLKAVSIISGRLGQTGEERVSDYLAAQLPDSYVVLNSPRISYLGEDLDIDHIVIGPNGVFAVESKNVRGKITGGLMGNWLRKTYHTGKLERLKIGNPANQVSHYSKIIRQFIKTNYQAKYNEKITIKVIPIVVFAHNKVDLKELDYTKDGYVGRVRVLKLDDLEEYILNTKNEEPLDHEIDRIADIIVPTTQRDQTGIFSTTLGSLAVPEAPKQEFILNERYILQEQIGRGSFGEVYKAYDAKLDRIVAIKKLYTSLNNDPSIVERFFREAKITARFKHENIVSIYDYTETDGDFYIIMEYIEGQTLDKYMQYHVLKEEEIVNFALAICSALQHAHDNEVIHRDLKPSNIIITNNKKIKVTDFGIASIGNTSVLTQSNTSVGSPITMAPEQILGQEVDKRADIFALGVILYFLNTRELPFKGNSIGEVVHKILNTDIEPPRKLNPSVPTEMEDIIEKSLAKHPDDRFQSIEEIGGSLNKTFHTFSHFHYEFNDDYLNMESQWARNKRSMGRVWRKLLNRRMHRTLFIVLIFSFAFFLMYLSKFYFAYDRPSTYEFFLNKNFSKVLRDPEIFAGGTVQLTGKLVDKKIGTAGINIYTVELVPAPSPDQKTILVANTDPTGETIWNNQNGYFRISGRIADENSEITILGKEVDTPLIISDRAKAIDPWEVKDPAQAVKTVKAFIQDNMNSGVYLDRLEFGLNETRAFIRILRNPHGTLTYDLSESYIEVAGNKYKYMPINKGMDYPAIPHKPTGEAMYYEGVILFKPIKPFAINKMEVNIINKNPVTGEGKYMFHIDSPTTTNINQSLNQTS